MSVSSRENPADRLIIVIDSDALRARNLKDFIEFLDVPRVQISAPDNWRSNLGNRRLAAVFLGKGLADEQIDTLMQDIGEFDPNLPIVMVSGDQADA